MEVRVISVPRPVGKLLLALTKPFDKRAKRPADVPADLDEPYEEEEETPGGEA